MTIDAALLDVAQLASQLVQIPSVNPMGKDLPLEISFEHRITDHLAQTLQSWDVPHERHVVMPATNESPARENLVALVRGAPTKSETSKLLLFEVHQDTVPTHGMVIPPWSGEIRDGRVHGRGACDIKGGMASLLVALARLELSRSSLNADVVFAFTVNEENGFSGAQHLRETWQRGASPILPRAPDAIVVIEPTQLNVVTAHKGCVRWNCRTRGRAAHSSTPDNGVNAIYAMARVVSALEHYARNIAPTMASHPALTPPSLSVGTINGGVSVNTVPDNCRIEIDRRVLPQEDPNEVRSHVLAFLQQQNPTIDMVHDEPFLLAGGLADQHNRGLADSLAASVRELGMACSLQAVAYGTDASKLAQDGIPTVVFGPGSVSQAHTADEWVSVDQLRAAADILHHFAIRFATPRATCLDST